MEGDRLERVSNEEEEFLEASSDNGSGETGMSNGSCLCLPGLGDTAGLGCMALTGSLTRCILAATTGGGGFFIKSFSLGIFRREGGLRTGVGTATSPAGIISAESSPKQFDYLDSLSYNFHYAINNGSEMWNSHCHI